MPKLKKKHQILQLFGAFLLLQRIVLALWPAHLWFSHFNQTLFEEAKNTEMFW